MNKLHGGINPKERYKLIEKSKTIVELEVKRALLDKMISRKTLNHETNLSNKFQRPIEEIVRQVGTITHKVYGGDRDCMVLAMMTHFNEEELRQLVERKTGENWDDIKTEYSYKGIFAYQHSYAWALMQPNEANPWLVYSNKKKDSREPNPQCHLRSDRFGVRFNGSDVYVPWEILNLNHNEFAQLLRLRCKFVRKYIPISKLGG